MSSLGVGQRTSVSGLRHGDAAPSPSSSDPLPESNEFVWVASHEEDFDRANHAYYESEQRKHLTPNPAVHIEQAALSVANVVL